MDTNLRERRIFMTGGAGFIGSKLCKSLHHKNKILIYDNLHRNSIRTTNLLGQSGVELVQGDILDLSFMQQTIDRFRPDIVIHMAAIAGIDTVICNATKTMKVNVVGTFNLLDALKSHVDHVERFINFSTSEVFGSYAYRVNERHTTNLAPVGQARWLYSVSKLAGEHYIYGYEQEYGLRVTLLRPFNVYGPGQVGEGAIHVFIKRALGGEALEIRGDGDQIRSWCYIEDMVQGVLLALHRKKAIGQVFNIGNPKGNTTILSLAEKIVQLTGSQSRIIHVPKRYDDVELRIPDIQKAKQLLGFEPKVDLNEGLKRTIEWYKKNEHS